MPTTLDKSAEGDGVLRSHASPVSVWMQRHAALLQATQTLLDVACGRGRHALFFAARGLKVTAVDRDAEALAAIQAKNPAILTEQRDLEAGDWPYQAAQFDAVLICNYLWRPALPALLQTVKPGGVLLYETFMLGNERYGKPSNPEFLLRSNELLQQVQGQFQVVAFEEGPHRDEQGEIIAMKQYLAARRLPETTK